MVSNEEWSKQYFDRIISMKNDRIVTDAEPEKENPYESG
jgi:ABC-type phosphate/phosphonate transport system ATPase subunit